MSQGDTRVLIVDLADGVLTMTLNRPEARNALSPELVAALHGALTRLEADDAARVGVITGAGSAFCAGLDLKVFAAAGSDRNSVSALIHRVGRLSKPLIGAVNGPTVTGGLELALGCDFLIGSPQAMFADTHATVGAFPGGGLTVRLSRAVGLRLAKAMSLAGLRLDARTALDAGLLIEIVERDALVDRAKELACTVAGADPEYVAVVRALYDRNAERPLVDGLGLERAEHSRWRAAHPAAWNV